MIVIGIASLCATARAQPHKMRIKIDSQPQQAAIYVDNKESGIKGYTPSTIRLPRGTYTIILTRRDGASPWLASRFTPPAGTH